MLSSICSIRFLISRLNLLPYPFLLLWAPSFCNLFHLDLLLHFLLYSPFFLWYYLFVWFVCFVDQLFQTPIVFIQTKRWPFLSSSRWHFVLSLSCLIFLRSFSKFNDTSSGSLLCSVISIQLFGPSSEWISGTVTYERSDFSYDSYSVRKRRTQPMQIMLNH